MLLKNQQGLYEIEIDNQTYQFAKWGADTSLTTLIKISKIVGKPLGLFLGSIVTRDGESSAELLSKQIPPDAIEKACQSLIENMDETVCVALIKKLASENVWCNDKKVVFDIHYHDKLGHLFKVVKTALEVQYGDFLGELTGLTGISKKVPKVRNHKAI